MAADLAQTAGALTGPALHEAKRAVRDAVIAARDALDLPERAAAAQAIAARIQALPSFRDAHCTLLTLPFRSEWDTRPLFAAALAQGTTIALPRVNGQTRMLDLHRVTDIEADTAPGYRGISEPAADLPRIDIRAVDWVLVPGVAFDDAGRRLGYGGGYYDRLLAMLTPGTPRIAGAYELQVVPRVPAAPHDLVVDAIATPIRMLLTAER